MNLENKSNDKRYFTIIPNFVLDNCNAKEIALYVQMKRIAGENGSCEASQRYLTKKLGWKYETIKKHIKSLIEKGLIEDDGYLQTSTNGGIQKIKCYKVADVWLKNNDFFRFKTVDKAVDNHQKGTKSDVKKDTKGVPKGEQKVFQKGITKNNYIRITNKEVIFLKNQEAIKRTKEYLKNKKLICKEV